MRRNYSSESGFTLIEIIASIAVIMLVLIAFLPIFPQTMAWSKAASDELVAGNLLGRVANDVRANPAALSLGTLEAGTDRTLTDEDLAFLPEYPQAVSITVGYDDVAGLHRAYIEVLNDEGKPKAASYVYIESGGTE